MIVFHRSVGKRCVSVGNGFLLSTQSRSDMHGLSILRVATDSKNEAGQEFIGLMLQFLLDGK